MKCHSAEPIITGRSSIPVESLTLTVLVPVFSILTLVSEDVSCRPASSPVASEHGLVVCFIYLVQCHVWFRSSHTLLSRGIPQVSILDDDVSLLEADIPSPS